MRDKKTYHHPDIVSKIEIEAFRLIEKNGGVNLSARHLCEAVGVSHNAVYHHFKDKKNLTDYLVSQAFRRFHEFLKKETSSRPQSPILELGLNYFRFCKAHPQVYKFMFSHLRNIENPEYLQSSKKAFDQLLQQVQGDRTRALLLWSTVHGLCSLLTDGLIDGIKLKDKDVEQKVRDVISKVL